MPAAFMMPVRSKKRKSEYDPYSGKEQSGKKAKAGARDGPSVTNDAPPSTVVALETVTASSDGAASYYRARCNATPLASGSVLPPPLKAAPKAVPAVFNVDTFNLDEEKALRDLGRNQSRALCEKYGVDIEYNEVRV
jgi:hypothetical protein